MISFPEGVLFIKLSFDQNLSALASLVPTPSLCGPLSYFFLIPFSLSHTYHKNVHVV